MNWEWVAKINNPVTLTAFTLWLVFLAMFRDKGSRWWRVAAICLATITIISGLTLAYIGQAPLSSSPQLQLQELQEKKISFADTNGTLAFGSFANIFTDVRTIHDFSRWVQYDCGMDAVRAEGYDHFQNQKLKKKTAETDRATLDDYRNTLIFQEEVFPLIITIQNKKAENQLLKSYALSVAEKFYSLISDSEFEERNPDDFKRAFTATMKAVAEIDLKKIDPNIDTELQEYCNKKHESSWLCAHNSNKYSMPPKKPESWCEIDKEQREITPEEFREIVKKTRFVHYFVARLYLFAGDKADAIKVLRDAKIHFQRNINVNNFLGNTLLAAEQDPDEVLALQREALNAVSTAPRAMLPPSEAQEVAEFCEKKFPGIDFEDPAEDRKDANEDRKICSALTRRYIRSKYNIERAVAYVLAREALATPARGTREDLPTDLIPTEEMIKDADRSYKMLMDPSLRKKVMLDCVDDQTGIVIRDIYAYATLSSEYYNYYVLRNDKPDKNKIYDARKVLTVARTLLTHHEDNECNPELDQATLRLWGKRISGHIKLADELLK